MARKDSTPEPAALPHASDVRPGRRLVPGQVENGRNGWPSGHVMNAEHRQGQCECTRSIYGDRISRIMLMDLDACSSEEASSQMEPNKVFELTTQDDVDSMSRFARTPKRSTASRRGASSSARSPGALRNQAARLPGRAR